MRISGTKINPFVMKKLILLLTFTFCVKAVIAQPPDCTDNFCGPVVPEWHLLGSAQTSVCEGTPFELTSANSTPLDNIDDFHWFFMDNTFSVIFDTLLFDTSAVPYLVEVSDSLACLALGSSIKFWVALQVTSPPCDSMGAESCWAEMSPLTVNLLPRASFYIQGGSQQVCVGAEVMFADSSCHGTDYFWNFGDDSTAAGTNPVHVFENTGNFTVSLTVSNSCGSDTYTRTIEVVDQPAAGFNYSLISDDYCFPAIVHLNDASNQWSNTVWEILPADTLLWCFTDTLMNLGEDNIEIEFKQPGDYEVTVTASNACGTDVFTDTISIFTSPTISLSNPGTFCDSAVISSEDLNFLYSGNIDRFTWTLANDSTFNSNDPDFDFTSITFTQSDTITLVAEGPCDTLTETVPIVVVTTDAINFDNTPNSICQNQGSIQLQAVPGSGVWSGLDTAILTTEGKLNTSMLIPDTYTLTYTVGTAECFNQADINIEILPAVNVNLATEPPACENLLFSPNVSYEGTIDTYSWTFLGANPISFSEAYPVDITFPNPDTVEVIIEVTGGCGTFADTITLEIQQNVSLAIDPVDNPYCFGSEPDTLAVNIDGGIWEGIGIINDTLGVFDPNGDEFNPDQMYTITYTYGSGACSAEASVDIEIAPSVTVTVDTAIICIDSEPQQLTASPPLGTWSGAGVDTNGYFNLDSVDMSGDYIVRYEYEDDNGCRYDTSGLVIVEGLPVASLLDTVQLCIADFEVALETVLDYSVYPEDGGTTRWNGPGANDSGIFNAMSGTDTLDEGFYTVHVEYKRNDCIIYDSAVIELILTPNLLLSPDTMVCISDNSLQLSANLSGLWSGGPGIEDATAGLINLDTAGEGTHHYTYTFGANTSCETSDGVMVQIIDLRDEVYAGADIQICDSLATYTLNGQSPDYGYWDNPTVNNDSIINLIQLDRDILYDYPYCIESGLVQGCRACDTLKFIIHSNPTANFEIDGRPCIDEPLNFINHSEGAEAYYWNFGNPNDPNDTSTYVNPNYPGYDAQDTYTITLISESEFECRDTVTQAFYVTTPPVVDFTLDEQEGCAPFEVMVTNNSYGDSITQMWCIVGNTIPGPELDSLFLDNITTDSTFDIVLKVENFCGLDSQIQSVLVHPYPIVDFGLNAFEGCSPLEIEFSNATEGNPNSFIWDLGYPPLFTDSLPPNRVYTTPPGVISTYTITLTAMNDCGIDSLSKEITVHPPNTEAFIELNPTSGCQPLTVQLNNYSTDGSVNSWLFIEPNGVDTSGSEEPHPVVTFDVPGIHTIILSAKKCGIDKDTAYVEVFAAPEVSFTHPLFACQGEAVVFTNTSTNIHGNDWDFGDDSTSTAHSPTHIFEEPGIYTVTLTAYSTVDTCPATFESTVHVLDAPRAVFEASDSSGCAPLAIDFTNFSTGNGPLNYAWQVIPPSIPAGSTEENLVFTFEDSGDYIVKLITSNANNCFSDTAVMNIHVHEDPISSFTFADEKYCLGYDPIYLSNNSQGAIAYEWIFQNDTFNTYQPVLYPEEYGSHEIRLTVKNIHECYDTFNQLVEILPSPQASFTPEAIMGCQPMAVAFTNTSTEADTYHWFFGNGDTSNILTPTTEYTTSGTFEAVLVAVNSNGCPSDTANAEITVWTKPEAAFSFFKAEECGAPMEVFFKNHSNGNLYNTWDFGDTSGVSVQTEPVHLYMNESSYMATLTVENKFGCLDTAHQNIDIYNQPIAALQLSHMAGCEPLSVTVYNVSDQASSYLWNGFPAFDNTDSLVLDFEESGTYDIELIAIHNEACADTLRIADAITVYDTPMAIFSYEADNNENIIGDVQFINNSIDANRFSWDFGDDNESDEFEPFHEYDINRSVSVLLIAYNDNGGAFICQNDTLQNIEPEWITTFFAPNAFSPEYGAEGIRVFKPVGIGLAEYEIGVYSPFGQLVWRSTALENGQPTGHWDGTFQDGPNKGELLPQGSYTWMAIMTFVNGEKKKETGSVTLLR